MALAVKRSILNEQQKGIIRKTLCIQPKDSKRNKKRYANAKDPIHVYETDEEYIHLPYKFGAALMQVFPNEDIEFPKVHMNYTGTLRDYQDPIMHQAWEQLEMHGTTTLNLHTGWGKTLAGAYLASRYDLMTCVLIPNKPLIKSWRTTFERWTDAKIWVVGQKIPPVANVVICLITSVHKIPVEYKKLIGTLIIDEAHTACTGIRASAMLGFHPRYIIAETATLEKGDGTERIIELICGTHSIVVRPTKRLEVYRINTGYKPMREYRVTGETAYDKLQKDISLCEERNDIILDLVKEHHKEHKILVMTHLTEHCELIYECLNKLDYDVAFLYGNAKSYKDSNILVGSISKIGTGFDPETFCEEFDGRAMDMLILCSSIKKWQKLEQVVGRVCRADQPIIYHLIDDDTIITSHWYGSRDEMGNKRWYEQNLNGGVLEIVNKYKKSDKSN